MPSAEIVDLALRAVRAACRVTRSLQDDLHHDRDVHTKQDRTPVTVADLAAQAVIALELGLDFVGEESAQPLEEDPSLIPRVLEAARVAVPGLDEKGVFEALRAGEGSPDPRGFWTLDPIDGTKGFLRGDHYCVSLAWLEGGRPRLGVLGCPRLGPEPGEVDGTGALVWAVEGEAPLVVALDGERTARRLEVLPARTGKVSVAESAEAAHSDHALTPRLLRAAGLTAGPPVRIDSQVKYAVVARGDAQVFLRRPKDGYVEWIWDHAAGSLVAEAAGCVVSDLDGRPLDFSRGRRLEDNRGLLVAHPDVHERLLAVLPQVEAG